MVITGWVTIRNGAVSVNGQRVANTDSFSPERLYKDLQCNYPKFFKMDKLCKLAFVAGEQLFQHVSYAGLDKNRISVALATGRGCIDVDKRYLETISVPSPALFVYTLPNIMLGELCIRHGFKGEQICLVSEQFDAEDVCFAVSNFFGISGMDACLCGWIDAADQSYDACLFWVARKGSGPAFNVQTVQQLCYGRG